MKKLFINSASTKSINLWKKVNRQIPELHSQCWTALICTRVTSTVCASGGLSSSQIQRRWDSLAAATLHIYKAVHKNVTIKSLTGSHATFTPQTHLPSPRRQKNRCANTNTRAIKQHCCLTGKINPPSRCGVCMFFPYLRGFSPCASASSHSQKPKDMHLPFRQIGDSETDTHPPRNKKKKIQK